MGTIVTSMNVVIVFTVDIAMLMFIHMTTTEWC